MRRITLLSIGGAAALLGCETFIALGDDYTEECAALTTVYRDADGDGDGNPHEPLVWCGDPPPEYVTNTRDCDDERADVNTRAPDDQCDGVDQDCDEDPDDEFTKLDCPIQENEAEACPGRSECVGAEVLCYAIFYFDGDNDGYGSIPRLADTPGTCAPPDDPGVWVREGNDCIDNDPTIHPGAEELCDGVDQNCNGTLGRVYLRQTFSEIVLNAGAPGEAWSCGTNSGFEQGAPSENACHRPEADVTPTEDGNLVGVGLGACVPPGTSGEVESPIVDTSDAPHLELRFHEWVDFTPEGTSGAPPTVTLSVQQGSQRTTLFSLVNPGPVGTRTAPAWSEVERTLDTFAGPSTSLVWSYESGDAVGWGGYAFDDVELVDEPCVDPH
ncbi:putative metal-binding motif-containing protein [Polyangium spumosum]|uniref:putative metal-binding motif-containing protein n=1 Tax=Polyangium spumosum TaxID=889282 RepID=UPI001478D7F6|nr:putative metal-binding motif-containing protein [Polyangium spumosum]